MAGMFGETGGANTASSNAAFKQQLNKVYAWYTGGFVSFVIVLAILEPPLIATPRTTLGTHRWSGAKACP